MTVLLAGDIGGTKTILRLVEAKPSKIGITLKPLYENRYRSASFPDLVPMVRQFLAEAEQASGTSVVVAKACFAIAGPVVDDTSKLTNLCWSLAAPRLSQELAIDRVSLINDFAAVGYGVLGLEDSDLLTLQAGKRNLHAPVGVIGAGTGLGQGFLIYQEGDYRIYGSEGGHSDFAPRSEIEFQLSRYLLEKHNIQRISVERVVSGQGIVAIYQFLRDRQFAEESPDVGTIVQTWEREIGREKSVDPAAAIAQAALAKSDRLSEQTMHMFVDAYGAEAGNLALKLLPYGGLYIAGGIAPKILPLIQGSSFLSSLIDKGRMLPLLEMVPVHIVLNPHVGLIGAALYASKL
ncbi:MAG: glucokinase [Tildeniella nuda ZEHNDER 1965/U140]|jgi:glucokinase|nr:glucokinase [Tildeniella nuda ZEHNDER 1965/U140]